jgi:hypothetical protein
MSSNTIIVDRNIKNISVIVNNQTPNLVTYRNLVNNFSLFQSFSAKFIETVKEMDTLQDNLSSSWQETSTYIAGGVVDAGYF